MLQVKFEKRNLKKKSLLFTAFCRLVVKMGDDCEQVLSSNCTEELLEEEIEAAASATTAAEIATTTAAPTTSTPAAPTVDPELHAEVSVPLSSKMSTVSIIRCLFIVPQEVQLHWKGRQGCVRQ